MKTCDAITADIRADICAKCPTPCEHQRDSAWHAAACAACPLNPPRYGVYGHCGGDEPAGSITGLGDLVAAVAQPIARLIDRATGHRTHVANCGGCKARQAAMNKILPL